ncbi:hypothetical protein F5Y09DRAFT_314977 [Xylaria sp. FL1042]|nr:hypothetical protein F5Y09DRAFT_314977 [Xylaria sp. FL1042]
MSFSIETTASGRSREYFEWRHSSGVEVEALGGRHSGWKLVRVSLPAPAIATPLTTMTTTTTTPTTPTALLPLHRTVSSPSSHSSSYPKRHRIGNSNHTLLGHSSDGKEVVAVCAGASMSVTKVLRFRFLGTGADGSLGARWAIMAVASALAIWNRDRRSRSGGPAYASAGF